VKAASGTNQRLKLTLDPRHAGQPDRKPTISGAESAGESDEH
jgi:hypothetical protein